MQQRVIAEIDSRHDMSCAKGHLLGLGEEVIRIAIEHHPANRLDRNELFRDQLGANPARRS